MGHRPGMYLLVTSLVLAWAAVLPRGAQAQPETPPHGGNVVTIDATDASVPELIRMLSRAADARIVLAADQGRRVSVNLREAGLEEALNAICDAAGLRWELLGDIYVVEPGNVEVQVVDGPVLESWRTWDGRLPEEVAVLEFVPVRTTVEGGSKLKGTLSAIVDDLKAAGMDIAIDPTATVGLAETVLEVGWHGDRNTVEHVLLRVAMAARAEEGGFTGPRFTVLQHADQDQHPTGRLRVVPGDRWTGPGGLYDHFGRYLGLRQPVVAPPDAFAAVGWQGEAELNDLLLERDAALKAAPAPLQAKIDLDLVEVPLSGALEAIEARLGKPISLAEGVKADTKVTVRVREAPILRVLPGILRPLGLTISYARGDEFAGVTVVPLQPKSVDLFYMDRYRR